MPDRRPLIRAPLLVAFVATMSLGAVQLVRNWPKAKAPPAEHEPTLVERIQALMPSRDDVLRQQLAGAPQELRELANARIYGQDDDTAISALLDATRSEDASVRAYAAGTCMLAKLFIHKASIGVRERIRQRLVELLDDPDLHVRVLALANGIPVPAPPDVPSPRMLEVAAEALRATDTDLNTKGWLACMMFGERAAPLLPLLLSGNAPLQDGAIMRVGAVTAVGVATPEVLQWLLTQLAHPQADLRRVVAAGIGELGPIADPVAPRLLALLEDDHQPYEVRRSAAEALARLTIPSDVADRALQFVDELPDDDTTFSTWLAALGRLARHASPAAATQVRFRLQQLLDGDEFWEAGIARCGMAHLACAHGTLAERQRLADELLTNMFEQLAEDWRHALFVQAEALVALASCSTPPSIDLPRLRSVIESLRDQDISARLRVRRLLEQLPR